MTRLLLWLLVALLCTAILWAITSTIFMVRAQYAIRDTSSLCATSLSQDLKYKESLRSENISLRSENLVLTGRVQAYELLLSTARGPAGIGGGR